MWWCLYLALDKFGFVFPGFQQFRDNREFGTSSAKIFALLFYLGREVCRVFIPDSRLSFPVWILWLPEAVTHTHLCSVALFTQLI